MARGGIFVRVPLWRHPELRAADEALVRDLLRALARWNLAYGSEFKSPTLDAAGILYAEERPGAEEFVGLPYLLEDGAGDCGHLTAARLAELWRAGDVAAEPELVRQERWPMPPLYHARVRSSRGPVDPSLDRIRTGRVR